MSSSNGHFESVAEIVARAGGVEKFIDDQVHLRDWFAMSALLGMLANSAYAGPTFGKTAYGIADQMMQARESVASR